MAMIPDNPLVGGTVLRRAAIASPNFVHNVAGWSINQDGTAEFQNAIIRALLVSSSIQATNVTINPGPLLEYGSGGQSIAVFTVAGSNNWVAPAGLVGSAVDTVICIGGGGGGDGSDSDAEGSGGGGACSILRGVAVTIGNTYHPVVGAGGAANAAGLASSFAGDTQTVTANPGAGAVDPNGGLGGAASTTPVGVVSFKGGDGQGIAGPGSPKGGTGGGSSASDAQAGNPGATGTTTAGGAGGAAPAGNIVSGGAGGTGGAPGGGAGVAGTAPGGGGGGGGSGNGVAGAGARGLVVLIYRTSSTVSLINSMAVAAGTDPNTGTGYQAGIVSYNPSLGSFVQLSNGQIGFTTAAGAATLLGTTFAPALVHLAGSDGQTYAIAHLTLSQTSTLTVNQTTFTQQLCTQGPSFPIALNINYRISGQIMYTTAAAAGVPEFQLIGAGGLVLSLMRIDWHSHIQATPYTNGTMLHMTALAQTYSDTAQGGAGVNRTVFFDGYITASTAGSIGLFAATSIATDTFTVQQGSYWRVEPIY